MLKEKEPIETCTVKNLAQALKLHPYTIRCLYFMADPPLAGNLVSRGGIGKIWLINDLRKNQ